MQKINQTIKEIEQHFDVNLLTYRGVEIWPLIRFAQMGKSHHFNRTPKTGLSFELKKLWQLWKVRLKDRANNTSLNQVYDYGIYSDTLDRRIVIENKYFSRIADAVQHYVSTKQKALNLEMTHEFIPTNRYYPSYYIYEKVFFRLLKSKLKQALFGAHNGEIAQIKAFKQFLDDRQLVIDFDEASLKSQVNKILDFKKIFVKILKKTNIKQYFIIAYYNNIKLGLILACKELGIPTIDIQHGRQGNNHLAYNSWYRVPPKGYTLLPDTFWVWSELDKKHLKSWFNPQQHRAVIGGNPWIAFYLKNAKQIDPVIDDIQLTKNQQKFILLTIASLEDFVDHWIVKAIRDMQHEYLFGIRIHPAMRYQLDDLKLFFNQKGILHVELTQSNELSIFSLLKRCDIHLTFFSTTAIEASYFQKPSAVIHELGKTCYEPEITEGILQYLANKEDLRQFITAQTDYLQNSNTQAVSEMEKVKGGIRYFFG